MNYTKYSVAAFYQMLLLILFALNIYHPAKLFSQTFPVDHYTETDGIINSTVYEAAQDSLGQMWFATRGGVSVYDGTYWKNYTVSDGLPSQNIAKIFIDSKNNIWALQERYPIVISLLNGDKWEKKFTFTELGIHSLYRSFLINYDSNGQIRIFIGTDYDGLICYSNGKWDVFNINTGLLSNSVTGIGYLHDSLFIATSEGLSVFSNGKITNGLESKYGLPDKQLAAIYIKNDEFLVSGVSWFGKLVDHTFVPVAGELEIIYNPDIPYLQILPYKNMGYYLGTEYAVYYYDTRNKVLQTINADNGLITDGTTHMYFDREDNLWICSYRGVNKLLSRLFVVFRKNAGLYDNEVTAFSQIEEGHYILGYNGAVGFYNGEKFEHIQFPEIKNIARLHGRVQDVAVDENKNVWLAASWQGLIKVTPENKSLQTFKFANDSSINVNSVLIKNDGEVLLAAGNYLYEFTAGKITRLKAGRQPKASVRKLFKDRNGEIYIGSIHNGLLYESENGWKQITGNPEFCSNNVYAFLHDSKNRKFAGLIDGLFMVQNDSLVRFNPGGNMINNPVYLILEDRQNRLWFGSDNGVYRWDGHKLVHFSIKDGLAGQEINRDAGLIDEYGHLWLGTNNGLSLYREEFAYDTSSIPPPVVRLTYARVDYDTISLQQPSRLKFNQNNLNFNFQAVSFIDENNIKVKFKLKGADEEYSEALPTYYKTIRYNGLHPGKYRLCIKAKNAIGVWSEEVCSAEIRISPPFYQTWWFVVLVVLLIAFFVYWILRYISQKQYTMRLSRQVVVRTRQLKESQRELKNINKSREKLYSIIAHDLRSPFNSMLGMTEILYKNSVAVSEEQKKKMIKSLYRTANQSYFLLENLLNWVRSQHGNLIYQPQMTDAYVHAEDMIALMQTMAGNKKIRLINLIQNNSMVYADVNMLRTIIRNLLSNAIKFTPEKGRIEIANVIEEKMMKICVSDNGIGMKEQQQQELFSESFSTAGTASESGTGLGLMLCREFVEKHGGNINVSSKLNEGSTFCFTLPLTEKA